MSDDITPDDKKWLTIIVALILLLLIISTYQFWPESLRLFDWPG